MLASYEWLKELTGISAPVDEIAQTLTSIGLEVEEVHTFAAPDRVVVARVESKKPHPEREKLTIVEVFDGTETATVLCGAKNVPEPGGLILFAQVGAKLEWKDKKGDPVTLEIAPRKMGGIESRGMICSETELNIGSDGDGIVVLPENAADPGTTLANALAVGDTVFEIGLTPNRPDCLGHIGIARDLAAALNVPFEPPAVEAPFGWAEGMQGVVPAGADHCRLPWEGGKEVVLDDAYAQLGPFAIDIQDPERCPRYGAAFVLDAKVKRSPFPLRYRLHVLGQRSINNLVDVTNLVMLETGHPIHGFDLEKIRGRRIVVRTAHAGETMRTLDGEDRQLVEGDLLICDAEGPVALAGVMGGLESEITESTKHVVIECAYFDPRSVRRTSRRLGLHTDASHRFERGVDPNDVQYVMARAASRMARYSQIGTFALRDALDAYPNRQTRRKVKLRRERLNALLGVQVPDAVPARVLQAIGCTINSDTPTEIEVQVPTWRPDIGAYPVAGEADLIEEVGRIWGYDNIPDNLPRVLPSKEGTPKRILFERALRESAAAAGLLEAVTLGFTSKEELERARVSTNAVALRNPLGEDRGLMRTSLLPGLAAVASRSVRRQVDDVSLFELGRVFTPTDDELPHERAVLGVLLAGKRHGWIGAERVVDFYDLKGTLEAIAGAWGAPTTLVGQVDVGFLHPRRCATVTVAGKRVGVMGELHPEVCDALDLDGRAMFAQLDVEELRAAVEHMDRSLAAEPPKVPAVQRDIALLVPETVSAGDLAAAMSEAAEGVAESVRLFDLYRGDAIDEGHKSVAFRILYRDPEATLTDKQVDKIHKKVAKSVKRFGAKVR